MTYRQLDLFVDWSHGDERIECGIDEVGRGPLAGPVVAAAVVLGDDQSVSGIKDSKKLTPQNRLALSQTIRRYALAWSLGRCDPQEIDELNILRASLLAMERAVAGIGIPIDVALVDGNVAPNLHCPTVTVVGGDASVRSIGAASIIAKVARDEEMSIIAKQYPVYEFQRNKGYPTPQHLIALKRHGPCPIHRKSFRPVAESLLDNSEITNSREPANT